MMKSKDQKDKVAKILMPDGREVILPIIEGTYDSDKAIDVRRFYNETGYIFYDPGFTSTGSCSSFITYIDGEKGKLLYRGYKIEDLAKKQSFLDCAYLLFHGKMPSRKEKTNFTKIIMNHTMVHEQIRKFYEGFRPDAHPMAIMMGVVGSLSAFYDDGINNIKNKKHRAIVAHRIIAKMPTIAAMSYKSAMGQPFIYPDNSLCYVSNFLNMMFKTPCERYVPNPVFVEALEKIFILHADHEQNASTSTVRVASSSMANPFACIAAGIAALWGPLHGGANEAVINMLEKIPDEDAILSLIEKAKDKNSDFRLMGFGHRIYKNYDPRAKILKDICKKILKQNDIKEQKLFNIAMKLEDMVLKDDYFKSRKLYPNVDFYSGIILQAIGIPKDMFTVLFALARSVGWISHWNEMMESEDFKICRPRQIYMGPQ